MIKNQYRITKLPENIYKIKINILNFKELKYKDNIKYKDKLPKLIVLLVPPIYLKLKKDQNYKNKLQTIGMMLLLPAKWQSVS